MKRLLTLSIVAITAAGCSSAFPLHPTSGEQILDAMHTHMAEEMTTEMFGLLDAFPEDYTARTKMGAEVFLANIPDMEEEEFSYIDLNMDITQKVSEDQSAVKRNEAVFSGNTVMNLTAKVDYNEPTDNLLARQTPKYVNLGLEALEADNNQFFRLTQLESTIPGMEVAALSAHNYKAVESLLWEWVSLSDTDLSGLGMTEEDMMMARDLMSQLLGKNYRADRVAIAKYFAQALEEVQWLEAVGPMEKINGRAVFPVQATQAMLAENMKLFFTAAMMPAMNGLPTQDIAEIAGLLEMAVLQIDAMQSELPSFAGVMSVDLSDPRSFTLKGELMEGDGEMAGTITFDRTPTMNRLTMVNTGGEVTVFVKQGSGMLLTVDNVTVMKGRMDTHALEFVMYDDVYNANRGETVRFPVVEVDLEREDVDASYMGYMRFVGGMEDEALRVTINQLASDVNDNSFIVDMEIGLEDKLKTGVAYRPMLSFVIDQTVTPMAQTERSIKAPGNTIPLEMFANGMGLFLDNMFMGDMQYEENMVPEATAPVVNPMYGGANVLGTRPEYRGPRYARTVRNQQEDKLHQMRQNMGIMMQDRKEGSMQVDAYGRVQFNGQKIQDDVIPEFLITNFEDLELVPQN